VQGKLEGEIKVSREETKASEARLLGEIKALNVKFNLVIALMILALTVINPIVAELLKKWLQF
jgi:hypothetical protein